MDLGWGGSWALPPFPAIDGGGIRPEEKGALSRTNSSPSSLFYSLALYEEIWLEEKGEREGDILLPHSAGTGRGRRERRPLFSLLSLSSPPSFSLVFKWPLDPARGQAGALFQDLLRLQDIK